MVSFVTFNGAVVKTDHFGYSYKVREAKNRNWSYDIHYDAG